MRIRSVPEHRVYTREFWSQEWTLREFLYCDELSFNVAPDMPEARLHYDYGRCIQPGETTYAVYSRLSLGFYYVKVEIDQEHPPTPEGEEPPEEPADPIVWLGVVIDTRDFGGAATLVEGVRQPSGKQFFTCKGLEFLLSRRILTESIVRLDDDTVATVSRAITFNGGKGGTRDHDLTLRGNLHEATADFVPEFANDLTNAIKWNARQITDYLLSNYAPVDLYDEQPIQFQLHSTTLLDWAAPQIEAHGRNVYDVLNELIDRRRGLAWWLAPHADDAEIIELYVASYASEDIELAGDEPLTIAANANQRSLDLDLDARATGVVFTESESTHYDQVVARGARRTGTFSISPADVTLEADWTTAQQTIYDDGASAITGYSTADEAEQAALNRHVRAQEGVERVYSWFRIPKDWNGNAGDGEGGDEHAVFPELPTDGSSIVSQPAIPMWLPGLRLSDWLPMRTDHDYTGTLVLHDDVDHLAPDDSQVEQLRPMAFLKIPGDTDRYGRLDRLHDSSPLARLAGGPDWSITMRMQQNTPGVILQVSGAPQHVIATTDFAGTDPIDEETVELDYLDNLICTVCLEADEYATGKYPEDEAGILFETIADTIRVLHIDAGEQYRLDYLVPGTVYDVDDGELVKGTSGGFMRDDRQQLERIARLAYEWYKRPREAFDLEWQDVNGQFELGHLITQIGSAETEREVNTLITEVRYDLVRGATRVRTSFAEMDVTRTAQRQNNFKVRGGKGLT